jgi:hypothetical protein
MPHQMVVFSSEGERLGLIAGWAELIHKDASRRLFAAQRGCSPRYTGVLRKPRKRQPQKRQLTRIVSTPELAFSKVAKKAAKGNKLLNLAIPYIRIGTDEGKNPSCSIRFR